MSKEETDLESWIAKTPNAEVALCDIEVIQQFASWLCHHAKKSDLHYSGEPLKLRSIQDILSSVKSVFNKVFPNNKIFSGSIDQTWYTNLRSKSAQEITRRDMKRGVQSASKAKPIGRKQINNVNETLLSINTSASIRKAVYVGTTFNSTGRSGEAAYACLDDGAF